MICKFNFKDKEVLLDAKKCSSFFSKLRGLMFGNDENPLVFLFDKPNRSGIHSFFVRKKFFAIWLKNNKVIDAKIIKPYRFYVRPKNKFNMLIEIPLDSEKQISGFLVGSEKDLNTL